MSVKEEPVSSKSKKNVEILEPGVSLVKPQRRYRRSVAILTRLFFAILFLGLGILAVYYSIFLSEKHQKIVNDHNISKTEFSLFHSQQSTKGVLTIEQNKTGGERHFVKYDLIWLQDDGHSRLLFNVTDPATKISNIYYAFQNHTLHVTSGGGCRFLNVGYSDFIYMFGIVLLQKNGDDVIKMGGKYESVEVFEGIPSFPNTSQRIIMPGYDNGPTRLAFAYSYPDQGSTCGWQIYFDSHDKQDKNHIEWLEYWFDDMTAGVPGADNFVDYTERCVNGTLTTTESPSTSSTTTSSP